MGAAVGFAMLAGGIGSERRPAFRIFGHGLVGGGWAALYFTAFASHAVPAARIVESPLLASWILAVVAAALIADSLRYRSQTVTALAYFLGFGALAVSELATFALVASVPLVASVLFVSRRFDWRIMARAAVPTAYGLFVLHAWRNPGGDPHIAQALILLYWLLFELFELAGRTDLRLVALNAACFVPSTYLVWSGQTDGSAVAPLVAACAYAAATVARSWRHTASRAWQLSAALAAGLGAIAIVSKLSGFSAAGALLAEGELLWVLGMAFGQPYIRGLGALVLGASQVHFVLHELSDPRTSAFGGHGWHIWTPMALAAAVVFYLNRVLEPAARFYSYAAAALVATVLVGEVPLEWLGVAGLTMAAAVYEIGRRRRMPDFVHQSAGLAVLALLVFNFANVAGVGLPGDPLPWKPQLGAAVLLFAASVRLCDQNGVASTVASTVASVAAGLIACVFLWNVLPTAWVALAWGALALALVEAALHTRVSSWTLTGHAIAMAAFGRVVLIDLDLSHRIGAIAAVVALHYYLYFCPEPHSPAPGPWPLAPRAKRAYLYTAAIAATLLVRAETPGPYRTLGAAAAMLSLQWLGRRLHLRDLLFQSYALGVVVFARWTLINLDDPTSRVLIGAAASAALLAMHVLIPREQDAPAIDRWARDASAIFAAGVLALLLGVEVSGRMLTMAWGLEGIALLAGGFAVHGRTLRLTGLAALLGCVLKLFFYDLRHLETPYRIASFLVLGILLIGVSWIYTRFRAHLERYL
jgi:hypothetical protein